MGARVAEVVNESAGGSSLAAYEKYLAHHRHRWRWVSRLMLAVTVVLCFVGVLLLRPTTWVQMLGLMLILIGFASLLLRDLVRDPPPWVENYKIGADGELETARELDKLPEGWHVRHDVSGWDGLWGNVDHVVVGPRGVFVLDSKKWRGQTVVMNEGRAEVRRTSEPDHGRDVAKDVKGVLGQAVKVNAKLKANAHTKQWVTAVLVVWADDSPDLPAKVSQAWLVPGAGLAEWLLGQGQEIPSAKAEHLWKALEAD